MLFGTQIEDIYLIILLIAGGLTILYLFFGDILEGVGEVFGFINPVLILCFFAFFSATGYLLENITSLSRVLIVLLAAGIALILDTLLHIFVLVPLSSAEESLSYTEESLKGRVGKIIVPIPEDGFGEIVLESKSGMISKPATGFDNTIIYEGTKVLVLEVKNGVLYVVPYENELDADTSV
ncbi:hypothetical protein [Oceanobacillus kapialis]|uniref:hypothetical protein n=1 Tax=Oceanobacillus kapialis TaxID=481353 RepID=UPI00384EB0B2